jgi:hypothetical protein
MAKKTTAPLSAAFHKANPSPVATAQEQHFA